MVTPVNDSPYFTPLFPLTTTPLVDGEMIYTLEKAGECVCEVYCIPQASLRGKSRKREFVYARHTFSALIINDYNSSQAVLHGLAKPITLALVGQYLQKDHATIMHSCKESAKLLSYGDKLYEPSYTKARERFSKHISTLGGTEWTYRRLEDIKKLMEILTEEKILLTQKLNNRHPNEKQQDVCSDSHI